jgi:hypothetical protein
MSEEGGAGAGALADRRRLWGAAASVALVATAAVLALVGGGGEASSIPSPPQIVGVGEVEELASELGHPIYWAGEPEGESLELAAEEDGSVYLRYLTEGAEAGDQRQIFLTVGTYPIVDAQNALRRTAQENDIELNRLEDGAVVLPNPSSSGSVYLAYPDSDLEIEVYHPAPGRALELIRSGAIEAVDD